MRIVIADNDINGKPQNTVFANLKSENSVTTQSNLIIFQRHALRSFAFPLTALISALNLPVQAQDISDIERRVDRFRSDAQSLYRLNEEDMTRIWEAYCGRFDPKIREDRDFAADIGKQLQYREKGILDQLLAGDYPTLISLVRTLSVNSETRDRGAQFEKTLLAEEGKLKQLTDGVVLKGSNHPFVQYAIEYGKRQHVDMCRNNGDSPKVCDKEFPGADGRPDLVTFEGGQLVIYEFKPDSSKAKDLGWDQVRRYIAPVVSFYQKYLPHGQQSEITDYPNSDYGGKEMLQRLKASSNAWDGKYLKAVPIVKTYSMCDKKF